MTISQLGKTGVYRLYDATDSLIYVGIGSDPESRFKDHARDKEWWPQVARKAIVWRDSRDDALAEEFETIRAQSPAYNRVAWEPRPTGAQSPADGALHVPIRVVRDQLGRRIDEAFFREEITVIEKNGEPRAALVPYAWLKEREPKNGD